MQYAGAYATYVHFIFLKYQLNKMQKYLQMTKSRNKSENSENDKN